MLAEYLVIGHFQFVDDVKQAIGQLRDEGVGDLRLYSPIPNHDLEEELYRGKQGSPVYRFTFVGGLLGCCAGFLMTIWMSVDWPLRVSAKPVVSIPPYVVIAFECAVLFGGILTLLGLLRYCRIPDVFRTPGFRPNFTLDTFGLVARVTKERSEMVRKALEGCGAKTVEVEYVR